MLNCPIRQLAFLIALAALFAAALPCPAEEAPSTAPALTTETIGPPAPAAPIPRFDRWIEQPRIGGRLPAIGSWTIDKQAEARPDVAPSTPTVDQTLLEQHPPGPRGISRYTAIYRSENAFLLSRNDWFRRAVAFQYVLKELFEQSGIFQSVEITTPTVAYSEDLRWIEIHFRHTTKTQSRQSAGAMLAMPSKAGIFYFTLTLEGGRPEAVEAAMKQLRSRFVEGQGKAAASESARDSNAIFYTALALLAIGAILFAVAWRRQRRQGT